MACGLPSRAVEDEPFDGAAPVAVAGRDVVVGRFELRLEVQRQSAAHLRWRDRKRRALAHGLRALGRPIFRVPEFAGAPSLEGHLENLGLFVDEAVPFPGSGLIVLNR